MTEKLVYIIDASSLIEVERLVAKDFFSPLFKSLEKLIQSGNLISSEEVLKELKRKDGTEGDIFKWANGQKNFFKGIDELQLSKVKEILKVFRNLIDPGKKNNADPFIIALALVEDKQQKLFRLKYIVVTEEKTKNNIDKPMIPDVCKHYGVECLNLNEFLKRELEMEIKIKKNR